MAAPRRGTKRRSVSTPMLLFWAALMISLGLGLGVFLSQSSCSRKSQRQVESRQKASDKASKQKVAKKVEESPIPEPEPKPQQSAPTQEQEKIEKVQKKKSEKFEKPEPTPGTEKQVKPPEKVAKKPDKSAAKIVKQEKAPALETQRQSPLPRMALVIDDLGYAQLELVRRLCKESVPFSVAVLPFQEFTRESAEMAFSSGKEVMLHLPMEPQGYPGPGKDPGPNAVMFDLKEFEIRARVRAAMDAVPHRCGVNNHMGSRITPDRTRMTWILQEIKARHYFFVDSRTEKDSVAFDVAQELKIPSVQRRVFLDDDKTIFEMAKQWERAIEIAHKEGQVLIIGHIYPETVEALEKLIPKAKGRVQFVKAGALAK